MMARVLAVVLTVFGGSLAYAEIVFNYDEARTERWRCRLCPFDLAMRADGSWTAGALHVDGATPRFGRDNALDAAGLHPEMQVAYSWRGEAGQTVSAIGHDLGSNARQAVLQVSGRRLSVNVAGRQLPRNIARDGRTPYTGTDSLTLPADWVLAYDTRGMSTLAASSRAFPAGTRRDRAQVGLEARLERGWRVLADYSRETKTGTKETHGDFLYQSAGLPQPVAYQTDSIGAGLRLERRSWLVAADVRNARFRNAHRSLEWKNAYAGLATVGRKALEPDNEATTYGLLGRAAWGTSTSLHGALRWGTTRQDVALLPYTTVAGLQPEPLPAASLDGRVRTFAGTFSLVSRFAERWQLVLGHRARRRDDQTRPLTLTPVIGDLYSLGAATTRPPNLATSRTSVRLRYRASRRVTVAVGGDVERRRRAPAEIAANDEGRAWIEFTANDLAGLSLRLTVGKAERDASSFVARTSNNPLTRRFHQAVRDRHHWRGTLRYAVGDTGLSLSMHGERRRDTYSESARGLQRDDTKGYGGDLSYAAGPVVLAAFHTTQRTSSTTAGSSWYPAADWNSLTADAVATAGLSAAVRDLLDGALSIEASYVDSDGIGRYATEVGGAWSAFPDLGSRHRALDVRVRVHTISRRSPWMVVARFYRQRYAARDWALDDVHPGTIANVLAFGRGEPNYTATLFGVAVERRL